MSDRQERKMPICRECEEPVDPNEIYEVCPGCGAEHSAGSLRRLDDGRVRCPECVSSALFTEEDVREILDSIASEAASHSSNYGSGMRRAREMVEEDLLSEIGTTR